MLYRDGVVFNIPAGGLRERVTRLVSGIAGTTSLHALTPLAVIADAESYLHDGPVLPVVRLWQGGRAPGGDNPFADEQTRHAIGTEPALDSKHLRLVIRHLGQGTPFRLDELIADAGFEEVFCLREVGELPVMRDSVGTHLRDHGVPRQVADDMCEQLDEMIANALYNAPVCEGEQVYRRVSRKLQVPVVEATDVTVRVGPTLAAISVRDRFGSLKPRAVLANLDRCYRCDSPQIDQKRGGAGLGFYMLLAGSTRLVINIEAGRSTEVIVVRDHSQRRSAHQAQTPSLSICEHGDG